MERGRHAIAALVVLAGVLWLYNGVLSSLVRQWASDDNYSHGFLIVPLALYFAWERRDALRRAEARPSALGLAIVTASLLLFAAGVFAAELFLTRISVVGVAAGAILFVWGRAHVRQLALPLALLPLMIPLPAIAFNQIAFPLQLVASRVGEAAIAAAGIPVLREGNVLEVPNLTMAVAEACSGIRSLISLITLAIVFAQFTERRRLRKAAIVLAAVPIAIAANAARVAGTGLAAHWLGPRAAEGFFHGFSGWLVFAVAFAGLIGVQQILKRFPRSAIRADRRLHAEEQCSPAR
ncbi:MAG TPA: exosortase A [Vicinamibacterales bacterium]